VALKQTNTQNPRPQIHPAEQEKFLNFFRLDGGIETGVSKPAAIYPSALASFHFLKPFVMGFPNKYSFRR